MWGIIRLVVIWIFAAAFVSTVLAHPGHTKPNSTGSNETPEGHGQGAMLWKTENGLVKAQGDFVAIRDGLVQIRKLDDSLVTVPFSSLSQAERDWVVRRRDEIRRRIEFQENPTSEFIPLTIADQWLAQAGRVGGDRNRPQDSAPEIAGAFDPFAKLKAVKTRWDQRYFYVESNGIPDHPMMIGITAWQQQVPLPQKYIGDNAWQIPLHPAVAKNPLSTKGRFLRGAIAVAVNGIPIFNPLNNRGDDAFLFGELDEFGGHCGRADDYHYHIAPVHLEKIVGKGKPIAYALDGYPIYGYTEPDGSPVKGLDAFNGHTDSEGHYHYHASEKYPYLNGGFHGEVVEKEGQVDPQPRAEPVRPALPPMRDARITKFVETQPGSYKLTYDVRGKSGTVSYVISAGSVAFEFVDPSGRKTTETYSTKENSRSGKGRRPPPPGDERPRGGRKPRREQDSDPAKPPNRKMSDSPNPASSRNTRKQGKLVVSSSSIDSRGMLSIDCTCDGKKQSPAVAWKNAPTGTKTFAISLWHTAPDQEKSYWVVYNIPPDSTSLPQDAEGIGTAGINDRRRAEFDPMCSKGPGLKTYHLTVFALSKELTLPSNQASRANLLAAIKDVTLAEGTLDFQYERKGAE